MCEPLKSLAACITQMGGDENAPWPTVNEGPECTPLDDMEFRTNARMRRPFRGARRIMSTSKTAETRWHGRGQVLGPPGRTRTTRNELPHRRRPTEAGCHTNACCEAGLKSQRKEILPTLATEKLTEPRFDVDAWEHPGLPDIRIDFAVVDEGALHYSSAMRKGQEEAPAAAQAERAKTNKYGKAKGGVEVTGISLQLNGRFGPGLDVLLRKRGVQTSTQQSSRQTWRTTTARVAKNF